MGYRKDKLKVKLTKSAFESIKDYKKLSCSQLSSEINRRINVWVSPRSLAQHIKGVKFIKKKKVNNVTYYSFKKIDSN